MPISVSPLKKTDRSADKKIEFAKELENFLMSDRPINEDAAGYNKYPFKAPRFVPGK